MLTLRIFFLGLMAFALPKNGGTVFVVLPDVDEGRLDSADHASPDHVPFILYSSADVEEGSRCRQFAGFREALKLSMTDESLDACLLDHQKISIDSVTGPTTYELTGCDGILPTKKDSSRLCWVPAADKISKESKRAQINEVLLRSDLPDGVDVRIELMGGELTSYHFPADKEHGWIYAVQGKQLTTNRPWFQPFEKATADIVQYSVTVGGCKAALVITPFRGEARRLVFSPDCKSGRATVNVVIGHLPPKPSLDSGAAAQGKSPISAQRCQDVVFPVEKTPHFEFLYDLCNKPPNNRLDRPVPTWRPSSHCVMDDINPTFEDVGPLLYLLRAHNFEVQNSIMNVFQPPACPGVRFEYE